MSNTLKPGDRGYLVFDNYPGIQTTVQFSGTINGVDYYEIPTSQVATTGINTTIDGKPAGTYHHVEINANREVRAYDPTGVLSQMYFGKGRVTS